MSNYKATPIKYMLRNRNESVVYVPIATANTYGLVKVHGDLVINDGVVSIRNEITRSVVFDTYKQFEDWVRGDYQHETFKTSDLMKGDIIRITEEDVSDYWCYNVSQPVVIEDFLPCESVKNYVRFDEKQTLNAEQKEQVRRNIGATSVGAVNSIINDVNEITEEINTLKSDKLDASNSHSSIEWNDENLRISVGGSIVDIKASGIVHDGNKLATENVVDNKISQIKKNIAYVFDTLDNFKSWLDGNYDRTDGVTPSDLELGDNILLKEDDVPDYWLSNKSETITFDDFTPWESYVDLADYLNKNNDKEYTPVGDYNPATKIYVDDLIDNVAEQEFNLTSKKPISNSIITRNIVVRKSGEDLADLYGSQTSIFADMNAVCICTSTYGIYIKGHIYEIYNQTNEAGNVVLVREIGVTDKKIGNTETFRSVVWQAVENIEPFKFEASVTISQPLTDKTEVSIDNSIVEQAKFGLAIARIVGQGVYLYAVTEPDVDIVIKLEV